jgi:hypothetical protein
VHKAVYFGSLDLIRHFRFSFQILASLLAALIFTNLASSHELKIDGNVIASVEAPDRSTIIAHFRSELEKPRDLEAQAEILNAILSGTNPSKSPDLFSDILTLYRSTTEKLAYGSKQSIDHKYSLAMHYWVASDVLTTREILLEIEQILMRVDPVDGLVECVEDRCQSYPGWRLLSSLSDNYRFLLSDTSEALRTTLLALDLFERHASQTDSFSSNLFYRSVARRLLRLDGYKEAEILVQKMVKDFLRDPQFGEYARRELIGMSLILDLHTNPDNSPVLSKTLRFLSDERLYPDESIVELTRLAGDLASHDFTAQAISVLDFADSIYSKYENMRRWDATTYELISAHDLSGQKTRAHHLLKAYEKVIRSRSPDHQEPSLWSRPEAEHDLVNLARAQYWLNDIDGALATLELVDDPKTAGRDGLYVMLAWRLLRETDVQRAKDVVEKAVGSLSEKNSRRQGPLNYNSYNMRSALGLYSSLSVAFQESDDKKEAWHYLNHSYGMALNFPDGPPRLSALATVLNSMDTSDNTVALLLEYLQIRQSANSIQLFSDPENDKAQSDLPYTGGNMGTQGASDTFPANTGSHWGKKMEFSPLDPS